MALFDTDDGLIVTQEGRDARARLADASFAFPGCDKARIVAIYQEAVRDVRKVFESRWAAVRGPNLHASELANLVQEATLHWMAFYLGNRLPAQITAADLSHPQTLRIVRRHVERLLSSGTEEAAALGCALGGLSREAFLAWQREEDRQAQSQRTTRT